MLKRPSILVYLIAFGVIATLPLIALVALNIQSQYATDRKAAINFIESLRASIEQQVSNHCIHIQRRIDQVSKSRAVLSMDPAVAQTRLRDVTSNEPTVHRLILYDLTGQKIADSALASPPTPDPNDLEQPWVRECLQADKLHISDAFLEPVSKNWSCAFSDPVTNSAGKRIGTLIAVLNLPKLSAYFFSNAPEEDAMISVFDSHGVLLMRSREADRAIGVPSKKIYSLYLESGGTKTITSHLTSASGEPRTFTIGPIPGTPWVASAIIADALIFAPAKANQQRSLWLLGGFALILAIGISWFARYLSRPIVSLAQSVQAIRNGQTFSPTALVDGPAEIRDMARAFNDLLASRDRIKLSLAASEQRYRTVIDLVPFSIYARDEEGRFVLANLKAAQTYATTPDQLIGKKDSDFPGDPAQLNRFIEENQWVLTNNQPMHIAEERYIDLAGRIRYLSTTKIPFVHTDDGQRSVLSISVDITDRVLAANERQQMEKKLFEAKRMESLGVLAGGIAHDFNNLLTGIIGNAELARLEIPADAAALKNLTQIEKNSLRAADLCQQMLAYSGKSLLFTQPLDLNELLRDTNRLLSTSLPHPIVLRLNLTNERLSIQADATQLGQVLMHLATNAAEAIGDRPGTIVLSTGLAHADTAYLTAAQLTTDLPIGTYACLEISDDGTGMTPETVAQIFDPFFTTKFTGRGLGLAAARGIIHAHNGAIRVYSELGHGTTIKLYFPIISTKVTSPPKTPSPINDWRPSGRALVVDDEESIRRATSCVLSNLGYTVDTANDGLDGLELFKRRSDDYKVILLDLNMPNLDGQETFLQMRQLRPNVRIIIMSGFNKADVSKRFSEKELEGFLQKPFEIDTLTAELYRVAQTTQQSG